MKLDTEVHPEKAGDVDLPPHPPGDGTLEGAGGRALGACGNGGGGELHGQMAALSPGVRALWKRCYGVDTDMDPVVRQLLRAEVAAIRSEGLSPDAVLLWTRLLCRLVSHPVQDGALRAAAALAGLATGLRPQRFDAASIEAAQAQDGVAEYLFDSPGAGGLEGVVMQP